MSSSSNPWKNGEPRRAAIIGGGLGGLSAAIHLRLAGVEVHLYEARSKVGGRANVIEREGFRFDTGPSLLNYPWVFEELFQACGRKLSDALTLLPVDPSIRFYWPDGQTFTLSTRLDRLREECERMEPGSSAGLMAFLADAEAKYNLSFRKLVCRNADHPLTWFCSLTPSEMRRTAVWRSLYGELGRFFRNPRLREALGSYAMYLGGSPWTLPGLFSILPYGELAYGLWLPRGGIYALVEAVSKLATEMGVKIFTEREVRKIEVRDRQAVGIEFADGTTESWPVIVSNVDVPTTRARLLGDAKPCRMAMTPGVITFYWGIRGKVEGLGHHTIFLPDDFKGTFDDLLGRGRISPNPAFYVSVPSDTDPSLAPPGDTAAFALVPTPTLSALGPVDWPSTIATARDFIFNRLRAQGATLDPARIAVEEVWTPDIWGRHFGLFDGSAFGASHTLFQMGPLRASNFDRQIGGLYYVGASTTPGTGVPMVTLGGKMTAERILSHAR
ncbi:MAG: phytoene desaturase family protein [Kiritimatiellia bacterium]|nr:phytoene desaturase family protein [Kiritimatiellia bacterium]